MPYAFYLGRQKFVYIWTACGCHARCKLTWRRSRFLERRSPRFWFNAPGVNLSTACKWHRYLNEIWNDPKDAFNMCMKYKVWGPEGASKTNSIFYLLNIYFQNGPEGALRLRSSKTNSMCYLLNIYFQLRFGWITDKGTNYSKKQTARGTGILSVI